MKIVSKNQIHRSLLQKAVRRGSISATEKTVVHLLLQGDEIWLRNRLGVIASEEAWQYISKINFSSSQELVIEQYLSLASVYKNKNAAGLGILAYELSKGDISCLQRSPEDRRIKIVAEAIKRPDDFWRWIEKLNPNESIFIKNSKIGFNYAGWPWDKAFLIAAAYLYVCGDFEELIAHNSPGKNSFPYWVAMDKHTAVGKCELETCASILKINKNTLGWIQFYLESSKCTCLKDSIWWTREKSWRFKSIGITEKRAETIWQDASYLLRNNLLKKSLEIENTLNESFNIYKSHLKNQGKLI